jgi:hypothetical protein
MSEVSTVTVGQPQGAVAVDVLGVGTTLRLNLPGTTEYRVTADDAGASVSGDDGDLGMVVGLLTDALLAALLSRWKGEARKCFID